ncbi:MAG: hypothetical protein QM564_12295 [Bergeyella sp.]
MTLIVEIENRNDIPAIKKYLESIKGVTVKDSSYENRENEIPDYVYEALSDYADNLKDEDMISHEDFMKFIDEERCRLNIQK